MEQFLGIGIVGVVVSLLIQVIKGKFGTETNTTKAVTISLAILTGGLFWFIQGTPAYQAILGILASASMVYNFIIKK